MFTRCQQTRIIYSLANPRAKHDSNIHKETAFQYFRRVKAYQNTVPNKSYAYVVRSLLNYNQEAKQGSYSSGQCTPLNRRVVNKHKLAKPENCNASGMEKSTAPTVCGSSVTGAGLKSCVSVRETPITLHNRFQILDTFSDIHNACDKVEDQSVLTETSTENMHNVTGDSERIAITP